MNGCPVEFLLLGCSEVMKSGLLGDKTQGLVDDHILYRTSPPVNRNRYELALRTPAAMSLGEPWHRVRVCVVAEHRNG
jgi:hypothetical protein